MKRIRRWYWYTTTFFQKHLRPLFWSAIAGIALVLFMQQLFELLPEGKPSVRIGMVGQYSIENLPPDIAKQISYGLTDIGGNGEVIPAVAERWTTEDNGRIYRFVVRDDLVWHDGSPLTPMDINYTFSDTEIVRTSREVIYTLDEEYAPFPVVVSRPLLKTSNNAFLGLFQRRKYLGLGEFEISSYRMRQQILQELVIESPSQRKKYRFYPTEERAVLGFKHGEVDRLERLVSTHALDQWGSIELVEQVQTDQYLGIFFQNSDPLLSKNLRQALNYAIPKRPDLLRARSSYNPDHWAYNPATKPYDLDQEKAVQFLVREDPPAPLRFQLTTTPSLQDGAREVIAIWEELGRSAFDRCQSEGGSTHPCEHLLLEITLQVVSVPDTRSFQVLYGIQQIPIDPDQYFFWHSTQPSNITNYRSPQADRLLENARKSIQQSTRTEYYQELQQVIAEDSPVIFLDHPVTYAVERL